MITERSHPPSLRHHRAFNRAVCATGAALSFAASAQATDLSVPSKAVLSAQPIAAPVVALATKQDRATAPLDASTRDSYVVEFRDEERRLSILIQHQRQT